MHDEIEALARLVARVIAKDYLSENDRRVLDRVAPLSDADKMLVTFASKILSGKPYAISGDDPEKVRRFIAFGARLGATVRSHDERDGPQTMVVFDPPSSQ